MRAAEAGFLTSRGYRAAKSRPASARTLSDHLIGAEVARLHAENYGVYGVRKMHRLLKRQGWEIGRDQTGRLMRSLGLRGVKRGKRVFMSSQRKTCPKSPVDNYRSINAMAESFFATLKTEFYYRRIWPTRARAIREVSAWIEDRYNRRQRHSSIGHITPAEFEMQYSSQAAEIQLAA